MYTVHGSYGVQLIFQYWYFIMETSSIHYLTPVVPFKALIGYFRPQQVLCSCCPQPRWCFPKMSNKQTLDVAHCSRDPSCGGPPDRCSQSTIPVTLLPSLTISCQFFWISDWLIQEKDGFWLVRNCWQGMAFSWERYCICGQYSWSLSCFQRCIWTLRTLLNSENLTSQGETRLI